MFGILGLGQPGLERYRGVHLLEEEGFAAPGRRCRSTTSMIGFAAGQLP